MALHEAGKQAVRGDSLSDERQADVILSSVTKDQAFQLQMGLRTRRLIVKRRILASQPAWSAAEYSTVWSILQSDPNWRTSLIHRSVRDLATVKLVPLVANEPSRDLHRRVRVLAFQQADSGSALGRPIEGLVAEIDLTTKRVDHIVDLASQPSPDAANEVPRIQRLALPGATDSGNVGCREIEAVATGGSTIRWEGWEFSFTANAREGVVLYDVSRLAHLGKHRILARASLSEMFVPYGSPDSAWYFRAAFDVGAYMMGRMIDSLSPGSDAPRNATFFSITMPSDQAVPLSIARAVALYERDAGVLRRSRQGVYHGRELVLRSVYRVGNYDYGINWIFTQDGTIRVDVELSGELFVQAVKHSQDSTLMLYGGPVTNSLLGVHHQHFFCFRLDFDIDGVDNEVFEVNTRSAISHNPHGNAFETRRTLLSNWRLGGRDANPWSSRTWLVSAKGGGSAHLPPSIELVPGDIAAPFFTPDYTVATKAAFTRHQLWITRYSASQLFAAGTYPIQGDTTDGLASWVRTSGSLANTDIVLWYTVGITHIPRPEDWPVVGVIHTGFSMRSHGVW